MSESLLHSPLDDDPVRPCPARPNCVCSRADAPARNRVEPLVVSGDPRAAFAKFRELAAALPRTTIVSATQDRLHAICRTRLGFADDLEARLDARAGIVHVRSASRVGYHDLGVNRKRLETLRRRFEKHQQESDENDRRVQEDLRRQLDSIERQLSELRAVYMQSPPQR